MKRIIIMAIAAVIAGMFLVAPVASATDDPAVTEETTEVVEPPTDDPAPVAEDPAEEPEADPVVVTPEPEVAPDPKPEVKDETTDPVDEPESTTPTDEVPDVYVPQEKPVCWKEKTEGTLFPQVLVSESLCGAPAAQCEDVTYQEDVYDLTSKEDEDTYNALIASGVLNGSYEDSSLDPAPYRVFTVEGDESKCTTTERETREVLGTPDCETGFVVVFYQERFANTDSEGLTTYTDWVQYDNGTQPVTIEQCPTDEPTTPVPTPDVPTDKPDVPNDDTPDTVTTVADKTPVENNDGVLPNAGGLPLVLGFGAFVVLVAGAVVTFRRRIFG